MKVCSRCRTPKPLADFYAQAGMADGHQNRCKECVCAGVRRNRLAKIDYYRRYDLVRANEPHRRAASVKTTLRRNAEVPGRAAAHSAVARAIRCGTLKRQPCETCGALKVHAHHDDYAKPLEVKWFCPPHHRQAHPGVRCGTQEAAREAA